jgi:putative hydrolase of the HAD superfamily
MRQLDAIVFDYGNVLAHSHAGDWQRLQQVSGVSEPRFSELYWSERNEYDRGDFTSDDNWREFGRRAGRELTAEQIAQLTLLDSQHWMHLDERMATWMRALKHEGYKLGLLSNMPQSIASAMRTGSPLMPLLDGFVFSAEVKLLKPEAAIYQELLRQLGTRGERTLFLDDVKQNVEGARRAGLQAVQFTGYEDLAALVAPFGLPAPVTSPGSEAV